MALAVVLMVGIAGCRGNEPGQASSADDGITDGTSITTSPETTGTADPPECSADTDCGADELCQDGACVPMLPDPDDSSSDSGGMNCGGEVYQATAVSPNVMIVLDRSGSMDSKVGDQGSKWEIAQAAVEQVVSDYEEDMLFGLMLYPGIDDECDEGMGCSPGAVFVDIGPFTASDITNVLADADTCSFGTPTAETLESLQDYAGLEDPERPNFILLITDGKSSCEDPVSMVENLRAQTPEIKTFVVGFGGGVDTKELEDMAQAGGTALPGDPVYYQADDAQSLVDAFSNIAGSVLSCSYLLGAVPPDPDELYVFANDMEIPRDLTHANGWDYDPESNQITFYGAACDLLQSGQAEDLQVVFGCPEAQ